MGDKSFYTPARFVEEQTQRMEATRGRFLIASCTSGSYLSTQVVERYQELLEEAGRPIEIPHLEDIDCRFSDSETCVQLDGHVGGHDVFLFQALYDPVDGPCVDHNYMALLIAARAFREHGARHITAVVPYLAYGRQDKPDRRKREPTTAKLMADLSAEAGVDRVVTWHPHSRHLRGFYKDITVNMLDPLTLFLQIFQSYQGREDVIAVAPDAGASKMVTDFARALDLKSAIASKYRPAPEKAEISEVIGDFKGKRVAIILDDMISSGGTVYALVKRLVQDTEIDQVRIAVSHNLCLDVAYQQLTELYQEGYLQEVVVTDSIPQSSAFKDLPFMSQNHLSDILARVINRIHYNRSVSELFDDA
jgi:ribose-phosphate pyrophosphokinase